MNLQEAIDNMSYRIHIIIGSVLGVSTSAILDHLDQIFLTVIFGFAGAIGAAMAKLLVALIRKSKPVQKFEEKNDVKD